MRDIFRQPDARARFEREGFVQVALLTADDIAFLAELHDAASSHLTAAGAWSFTAASADAAYRRAMSDGIRQTLQPRLDTILDRCRAIVGNFFHKQPSRDDSHIHLHQDWSWVDEHLHQSLTVWCPFQPVNEANGTLAVVPGSHRLTDAPRGFVNAFPYPDLEPLISSYSRHLSLEPGDAVLFHQRLFHWSGPNRTATRRLAANCFVAPEEAAIRFPHTDPQRRPGVIELFEADDALLTSFAIGQRPASARSLGFVDSSLRPIDAELVRRILEGDAE